MPIDSAAHDEFSYAEPDKVKTTDLALDLNVDFDNKQITGTATYTLQWLDPDATQLVLDTRDLSIDKVEAVGPDGKSKPLRFTLGKADATLGSALTIPLRSWLVEESGQHGKLWVARQLIDQVRGHVKEARLLIDAWFMRKSLILPLLEQKVRIIGQVRHDTALYLPPEPEPIRRGPKRKYGRRIDAAMLDTLSAQERVLILYGKMQRVRLRSVHCRGAIPQGCARASGVVRDASGRQHLVASAIDFGNRDGTPGSSRGGNLRRAMGYRAIVSQPEAMVGCDELVAAIEGRAGTVDADSLHGVCPDASARPEVVGIFPVDGNRALAQRRDDYGGTFRAVDANPIYRTSRTRCLQPEVGKFCDAFPRSGSAFAVLRGRASRLSVPDRYVLGSLCLATIENSGRQAAACV